MIATFYPGSSIRAQDLNDDFDQIRLKQQEIECEFERFEEEIKDDVVLKEELFDRPDQESGKWSGTGDQEYVATSGAIAARHDAYVQDNVPAKPAMNSLVKVGITQVRCGTATGILMLISGLPM